MRQFFHYFAAEQDAHFVLQGHHITPSKSNAPRDALRTVNKYPTTMNDSSCTDHLRQTKKGLNSSSDSSEMPMGQHQKPQAIIQQTVDAASALVHLLPKSNKRDASNTSDVAYHLLDRGPKRKADYITPSHDEFPFSFGLATGDRMVVPRAYESPIFCNNREKMPTITGGNNHEDIMAASAKIILAAKEVLLRDIELSEQQCYSISIDDWNNHIELLILKHMRRRRTYSWNTENCAFHYHA